MTAENLGGSEAHATGETRAVDIGPYDHPGCPYLSVIATSSHGPFRLCIRCCWTGPTDAGVAGMRATADAIVRDGHHRNRGAGMSLLRRFILRLRHRVARALDSRLARACWVDLWAWANGRGTLRQALGWPDTESSQGAGE